jgi:hypothetical protein
MFTSSLTSAGRFGNRGESTAAALDGATSAQPPELTILMPCLNEARTLGTCIGKAKQFLEGAGIRGEILVADNGSTDGSQALARNLGARVVDVPTRGYGAALIAGIEAARGRYVIMGDSDDSYNFADLSGYLESLRAGNQLVMGNRFAGGIKPGAMPLLHRWLGNPVLSFIGRLLFQTPVRDFHCGLRGFDRRSIASLELRCEGMEFASEMVVKASLRGLRIAEVPTTLSPDGRDRPPHLRTWRDGWRHLRFLLLFSPRWMFLYPGLALTLLGVSSLALLSQGAVFIGSVGLDVHTMLYAAGATMIGVQVLCFAICAKTYAVQIGVLPDNAWLIAWRRHMTVERGLILGVVMLGLGLGLSINSILAWERVSFGAFDPRMGMRLVIPSLTITMVGFQVVFASMLLGVLSLQAHARRFA